MRFCSFCKSVDPSTVATIYSLVATLHRKGKNIISTTSLRYTRKTSEDSTMLVYVYMHRNNYDLFNFSIHGRKITAATIMSKGPTYLLLNHHSIIFLQSLNSYFIDIYR